ncbi:MAG: UDP-3-O-(3-hydroxymyristoyl)glucosamine N-acyltransferase [Desulfobulbaceae bacterium]|nr:UDP-3-O-(3-hydroxymyristoyl)glucosamine N-acyltransferase [Desulfobulbaceae bacterium]
MKASELAELIGGKLVGEDDPEIIELVDLASAGVGQVAFVTGKGKLPQIEATRASLLLVSQDFPELSRTIVRVNDPVWAATVIQHHLSGVKFEVTGVHPSAVIGADCCIPDEVSIAPLVCLGARVQLGRRIRIGAGCVIGDDVVIGDDTVLHPNVTVLARSILGARVIVHSGAVIGSDGFGYAHDRQGRHLKRLHVGYVQIDDDVELGANVCVDRATFGKTWIKRGTKIDNLVQVAHNVEIGEDSILVSQCGISGSTVLGNGVVMGGKAAISGHLRVGNRVTIAAKAGVTSSFADGEAVAGFPAIPHRQWLRAVSAFPRLPEMLKELREIKKLLVDRQQDQIKSVAD